MRGILLLCVLLMCAAVTVAQDDTSSQGVAGAGVAGVAGDGVAGDGGFYYVIPVHGPIDSDTVGLFKIHLQKARQLKPDLVILDVNSPGGSVYAAETIIDGIIKAKDLKFAAFVRRAMSAAAGISLTCSDIYMTETATMGAAVSYMMQDGKIVDAPREVKAKFQSVWRAACRKAAIAGGHSPLFAEGMIDQDIELVYAADDEGKVHITQSIRGNAKGQMLKSKGTILCVTALEAVNIQLADFIVEDVDALGLKLGMQSWRDLNNSNQLAGPRIELPRGFAYPDELVERILKQAQKLGLGNNTGTSLGKQTATKELAEWFKKSRLVGRRFNWTITMLDASESESQQVLPMVSSYLEQAKDNLLRAKKAAGKKRIERVGNYLIENDLKTAREMVTLWRGRVNDMTRMRGRLMRQPVKVYAYTAYADNMIVSAWFNKNSLRKLSNVSSGSDILMSGKIAYIRYGPCEAGESFLSPKFLRQSDRTISYAEHDDWMLWVEMEDCKFHGELNEE